MKLTDEFEDQEGTGKLPLVYMTIGIVTFLALVICIVAAINHKDYYRDTQTDIPLVTQQSTEMTAQDDVPAQLDVGTSSLTSDQLDFWNMYREDTSGIGNEISANTLAKNELYEQNAKKLLEEEAEKEKEEDLSEGGIKTKVIRPDGTEQWVMINAYINKNKYDEVGFIYEEPVMKYFQNGSKQSKLGAVLKDSCGTVDFTALRKEGVEFVMIRVGYRGYESGTISLDARYFEYMQEASDAGLMVGTYFESQAVSDEEALEEAEFVSNYLVDMNITYPVVFKSGLVANATSRVEYLTKSQLSRISNVFCERIAKDGCRPAVYGDKYWLLRRLDLTLLGAYDIWLAQEGELPDYPYEFSMWQYDNDATVYGVNGEIPLCISFVDYSQR